MRPDDAQDFEPGWRADPTGRHDYRWWTGVGWSDQVGDRGEVTIDRRPLPRATHPSPPRAEVLRQRRRLAAGGLAGVLALGVAGVAWRVVGEGEPDDGLGVHVLDPDPVTSSAEQVVRLSAGDVVRIRAEPSTRVDTAVHVLADETVGRAVARIVMEGSGDDIDGRARGRFPYASDVVVDADARSMLTTAMVLATIDTGGNGGPDAGHFTALVDSDVRILVEVRATRGLGPVRLVIERFDRPYDPAAPGADTFYDAGFFTDPGFYRSAIAYDPAD